MINVNELKRLQAQHDAVLKRGRPYERRVARLQDEVSRLYNDVSAEDNDKVPDFVYDAMLLGDRRRCVTAIRALRTILEFSTAD